MHRSGFVFGYCLLASVFAHALAVAAAWLWLDSRFTPPRPYLITVGVNAPSLQGQLPKAPLETQLVEPLPPPLQPQPKILSLEERADDGIATVIPADLAAVESKPAITTASIPAPPTPAAEKSARKEPPKTQSVKPQAKPKPNVDPDEKEIPASANSRPSTGARPDQLPRLLSNPAPGYPADLLSRGIEGTVLVRITVTAEGTVAAPQLVKSSGHPAMDESALRTITLWRFEPARLGPRAVACVVHQPVEFFLTNR